MTLKFETCRRKLLYKDVWYIKIVYITKFIKWNLVHDQQTK